MDSIMYTLQECTARKENIIGLIEIKTNNQDHSPKSS